VGEQKSDVIKIYNASGGKIEGFIEGVRMTNQKNGL